MKLTSKNSNLCDHNPPTLQTDGQTDGRTDRQTTCDRNTALCTKVHRAVKTQCQCLVVMDGVVGDGHTKETVSRHVSSIDCLSLNTFVTAVSVL